MEWQIQDLSVHCSKCQASFHDGDPFYCFLVLSQEGIPLRNDFCKACFEEVKSSWMAGPRLYSYWASFMREEAPLPKPKPLPYEHFETLLRKYILSEDMREKKFAYILLLLLERKKIFTFRESVLKEGEKRFLVYDHAQTGESFVLEDPSLSLAQLGEVQKELKEMMDQELQLMS